MTQTQLAYHAAAWCCYRTTDARQRRYVGCRHLSPASAIAHSDTLAGSDAALSDAPNLTRLDGPSMAGPSLSGSPDSVDSPPRPSGLDSPTGDPQPLRLSGDGFTPISSPQPGSGSLEPSPELREHSPG